MNDTGGRCYEEAGRAILNVYDDEAVLVHATVHSPKHGAIGHAWVEADGVIIDPTFPGEVPIELYRALTLNAHRYPRREALAWMVEKENYGPWHPIDEKGASL